MSGMISALNIAYEEKEHRGFFVFNSVALALTLGFVIGWILALVLVAGLPSAVQFMGLAGGAKWLLLLVQWPVLAVLLMLGLAVLYRYGPSREAAQWRWVSPGAVAATVIWIVASVGFTVYVANFSSYDKTYGSLGGAVVLLTWLYISAFVVLLGAAINAQTEQQTRQDTTTGEPREIGDRGARAADRVGPSAERR
jgi:membrane protein